MVVVGDLFVINQEWLYMNVRMLLIPDIEYPLDVSIFVVMLVCKSQLKICR